MLWLCGVYTPVMWLYTVQFIITWTVVQFLFYCCKLDLKWNDEYKVKVQTVTFNLRVFTLILSDRCRNYIPGGIWCNLSYSTGSCTLQDSFCCCYQQLHYLVVTLSKKVSEPTPVAVINPQTIIPPPLCFTDEAGPLVLGQFLLAPTLCFCHQSDTSQSWSPLSTIPFSRTFCRLFQVLSFFLMMSQTVYFGKPIIWPISLTVLLLFLSLIMASLMVIGTSLVLMVTITNNSRQSKA